MFPTAEVDTMLDYWCTIITELYSAAKDNEDALYCYKNEHDYFKFNFYSSVGSTNQTSLQYKSAFDAVRAMGKSYGISNFKTTQIVNIFFKSQEYPGWKSQQFSKSLKAFLTQNTTRMHLFFFFLFVVDCYYN